MDNFPPRLTPFIILSISIALLLLNNLISTPMSISDTNPSTYIIVPMLMLIPFSLFMYKSNIKAKVNNKDIIIGIFGFALFLAGSIYINFIFPVTAGSFKANMVLFPLAIGSFAAILFGMENMHKFWPMMLYSIFASPVLLMPLFNVNLQFSSLNTQVIYHLLNIFYQNVSYSAPITINFNGTLIGIGEACAGIGAIIALVMFMLPIAYFYDGKAKQKVYWLISGVILLFVLNLIRMLGISALWIYYGMAQAASFIHLFAGITLFYLTVLIIVIKADSYNISYPAMKSKERRSIKSEVSNYTIFCYGLVLALGMAYIYASSPFANLPYLSPLSLQHAASNSINAQPYLAKLSSIASNPGISNYTLRIQPINSASLALFAINNTFNYSRPRIVIFAINNNYSDNFLQRTAIVSSNYYVDPMGNSIYLYKIDSNGHGFYLAYSPILLNSSQTGSNVLYTYVIMPENVTVTNANCNYNRLDSYAYSLFGDFYGNESNLSPQFCIADSFIKTTG